MLQSVCDEKPGTLVLATGDAAEAEYSDGFLKNVERALSAGWIVELVAWSKGISSAWRSAHFHEKWGDRFRIIERDGRIYLTPEPKDILLFVAGGLGGLHATALHTFGSSLSQTEAIAQAAPAEING